jgi:propanol-preferring alcohol dehydrogenase
VNIGDRVGITFMRKTCGGCEYCFGGWEVLCPKIEALGYIKDGCMAEYVCAVGDFCIKIPDELSDEQAARKYPMY